MAPVPEAIPQLRFLRAAELLARGPDRDDEVVGTAAAAKLHDGTTVTVFESEAFSDDNTNGFTLRGTAVSTDDGTSLAMYES